MTGTIAGYDAFWKERVAKEVKTHMRHQEHFNVVDGNSVGDLYHQMRGIEGQELVRQNLAQRRTTTGQVQQRYTPDLIGMKQIMDRSPIRLGSPRSQTPKNFVKISKVSSINREKLHNFLI